jgi:group I intron endonuclease
LVTQKNSIQHRLKQHFKLSIRITNKNNKFSNAILKHGRINFIIETLFEFSDKEEALKKEISLIKELDTIKMGYNTTEGGSSGGVKGRTLTTEHKEKLRIANLNKIVTDDTRTLISKNHADVSKEKTHFIKKKHTAESKEKIGNREYPTGINHHFYQTPLKTSFKEGSEHPRAQQIMINGVEYGSLRLAAKALNTYPQLIF